MNKKNKKRKHSWQSKSFAAAIVVVSFPSQSAEFEPAVLIGVTYTDNVFLTETDTTGEFVYRIEPSIDFSHESARVSTNVSYLFQSLWYDKLNDNATYHRYDANVEFGLIPEILTLEIGGDRTQTIVDPALNVPQTNIPLSSNRTNRDEYYILPRLQSRLGSSLMVTAQYRHSWIDFSTRAIQGAENRDAVFRIDNYLRGTGITWALNYDWRRSEYDTSVPWENQRATAELGVWVTEKLRVFGSGGKESAWTMPLDPALEDSIWEAGFSYNSGDRLRAEFATGERSFGSSWRGSISTRFRRGTMGLTYAETPNTESRSRFSDGSVERTLRPTNALTAPGRGDRFILKRLAGNVSIALRRTNLSVTIYDEDRSDRTSDVGGTLDPQFIVGAILAISFDAGPRTVLRASAARSKREFELDDERTNTRYLIGADYKLGEKATLSFEYRHNKERGDKQVVVRNYKANSMSLFLRWAF